MLELGNMRIYYLYQAATHASDVALCPTFKHALHGGIVLFQSHGAAVKESIRLDEHPFWLFVCEDDTPPFQALTIDLGEIFVIGPTCLDAVLWYKCKLRSIRPRAGLP